MAKHSKSMSNISYEPVVTESIAVQIAEKIRESILDGRLKVNDRLPTEDELARQFDVSRPTVREALKRLAAQHLVQSRRGPTGGTFIRRPSLDDLNSNLSIASTLMVSLGEFDMEAILEARQDLEIICARSAAVHRLEEHLTAMAAEIEIQRNPRISDVDFCASDVRFHRLITEASANAVMKFLMHAVIEALQPVENMIIFRVRERERIVAQHVEILDAIRARSVRRVEKAIINQMTYIRDQFAAAETLRRDRQTTKEAVAGTSAARGGLRSRKAPR